MNVDFIADLRCLWSYVAWRQLRTALKECAVEADISFFPIFRENGLTSAAKTKALRRRASPLLEESGIFVDFDALPELSGDFSLCVRLIRAAFREKKYKVLDEIFGAYFAFGRDISRPETLEPIAVHHGLDPNGLNDDFDFSVLPVYGPEGMHAVSCVIFNGVTALFGTQGIPCLKNMIRLNRRIEDENILK